MTPQQQQELMVKFARCKFKFGAASYEESDCAGAAELIYRDYAGIVMPKDRTEWSAYFDTFKWPVDLVEFDVLLFKVYTDLDIGDHCGVYIGNGNVMHFGRTTHGMMCHRLDRMASKIANVIRYKK